MNVKQEILTKALELFNEFGSENISANQIAKAIPISPGTLYYYFKNKEEIIRGILAEMGKEYDSIYNKPIDFSKGISTDFILYDDLEFLDRYRFISCEINILIKNDDELRKLYNEIKNKQQSYLYMIFKLFQNQEIIEKNIEESLEKKVVELMHFNGMYNPFIKTLNKELTSLEALKIQRIAMLYGFLTEKGKEFFETEKILRKRERNGVV